MENPSPLFEVGEVAILQPPHPSAKAYWGMETVILQRVWGVDHHDAFGGTRSGWSYKTDIDAPPPTDDPRFRFVKWIWCEYDLRKKYRAGDDFNVLVKDLNKSLDATEIQYDKEGEKV